MKNKIAAITVAALTAFASGCDKNKEATTSQQIDNVKAETKAAAQDMKDYTFAQKAEFTATMQSQLNAINSDLDQLSAKIDKSTDAVKAEAKPKLQALRDQSDKLAKQLDAVKDSTESTWGDVKAGFNKAYNDFKDGVNQSRQWVSDKISP
jgi:septal ring factor EnvC (AmiA/AmiB activator)